MYRTAAPPVTVIVTGIVAVMLILLLPGAPRADEPAADTAASPAPAAPPSEPAPEAAPPEPAPAAAMPKMVSYELVLLKRGPSWTPEVTDDVRELQRQHIAHMTAEGEAGRLVVAGPVSDQVDPSIRGICLYRVGSLEEARRRASADPMVQAGRLAVEVMTWWVEDGYMTFPKAPPMQAAPPAPASPGAGEGGR